MGVWTEIIVSLSPFLIFTGLWAFVYFRGGKVNRRLLVSIENEIRKALDPNVTEINKVKIRSDEYEFRCNSKTKNVKILTLHLRLVSRSFIIQWIINLFIKERDRLFIGTKFGSGQGEENPVYRFDVVPYRKKTFISQRFDTFIAMDDIPTVKKSVDQKYMIKSESVAYVEQFTDNEEFVDLIEQMDLTLEHLTIHKSQEDTDPHFSVTYEFYAVREDEYSISNMIKLFFLTTQLHVENHDTVKKKLAKGKKGKSMTARRGAARSVASRKKKTKKKRVKKK